MKVFRASGFPTQGDKFIELPDITELLEMPWFQHADAEDVYKSHDIYKYLLDQAPLTHTRKYILATGRVQLVRPGYSSIRYGWHWHVDGDPNVFKSNDLMHLLETDCSALTEFNTDPFELDLQDDGDQKVLNATLNIMHFPGKSILPNQWVTFDTTHVHRAVNPQKPEFRFMFRIIESDSFKPKGLEQTRSFESHLFKKVDGEIHQLVNIAKHVHGTIIFKEKK